MTLIHAVTRMTPYASPPPPSSSSPTSEANASTWWHGDVSDAELRSRGLDPSRVLDFAVNVDPLGPPPEVLAAAREAAVGRYPDPHARELVSVLSTRDGVDKDQLVVGTGATGILWAMCAALRSGGAPAPRVVIAAHSFAEYERAAMAHGLEVEFLPRSPRDGLALVEREVERRLSLLRKEGIPFVVVLGHPDNPSGIALDLSWVAALARVHADAHFVLDEAFLRLSTAWEDIWRELPSNVLRIRSLTKELGMPGLRVGYAAGAPAVVRAIADHTPPWSVGAPALAAATVGAGMHEWVPAVRRRMREWLDAQRLRLAEAGWTAWASTTVYHLVEPAPRPDAAPASEAPALSPQGSRASRWARGLRRREILVRDCSSFGLPNHLRLCARPSADGERLIRELGTLPLV